MNQLSKNDQLKTAIFISLIFHALLLTVFCIIQVGFDYKISDFTEIAFASRKPSPARPAKTPRKIQPPPSESKNVELPSEIVKLPLRQMLEEEIPLKVANQRKKVSSTENDFVPQLTNFEKRESVTDQNILNPVFDEKEVAQIDDGISPENKILPSITPTKITGTGSQSPFEIEGQVANRTVAYKVIPDYPPNLQKQAVVKISFTVLPNGRIGEMIPQIKADAQLENITMDALRQWRFNALPSHEEQRVERGVITFRYLLK
jgi:outer membrane biosynthesis protein TonB